jgi:hypothetical protein
MKKKGGPAEEEASEESVYYPGAKREYNLDIFGFDFTALSTSMKYLIGFGLIGAVFAVVLYALKKIAEFNKKDDKKKKKNK